MIPKRIHGANRWMGAPIGWTPEVNGHCSHLAVRVTRDNILGGNLLFESAWEPTPEDLDLLNKGGSVILRVVGGQLPVALYVEKLVEIKATEATSE